MLGLRSSLIALAVVGATGACASQSLQLRRVVLYQNGIGYFEHTGTVANERLRFFVKPYEVDDILKTLTVVSKGTSLSTTVHTTSVDEPATAEGTTADDAKNKRTAIDVSLAHVRGEKVSVSYAVPTPTWKATYRVVLPERGGHQALLQGWAALQNTSDEDWNDIELTLATGAPFSYAIDLHSPEFVERPDLNGKLVRPAVVAPVEASRALPGDSDGDGIPDASDLCFNDPEDKDGFEDADGCPDPDNDKDRILDIDDQCPADAEVYNGIDDEDGCPDRGRVVVTDNKIEILDKIYFTKNSADLRGGSMPIVEAIAATLVGNPDITLLEVQGHAADNEGNANRLGRDRADRVVAALIKRGVDISRLAPRSYAATNPTDPGKTKQARAKNRRVEFLIVRRKSAESERNQPARISLRPTKPTPSRPAVRATDVAGSARYRLPDRISIPKGESTLVPIVNRRVAGAEVYLFRPDSGAPGSDRHPFRAARVANGTGVSLPAGPVAVFAGGSFAGEGLLQALFADEVAYVPYAIDSSTVVASKTSWKTEPSKIVSIADGIVQVEDFEIRATEFTVKAGRHAAATVFVRHQPRAGFEPVDLPAGTEESPQAILVPVPLRPSQVATQVIAERRATTAMIDLRRPGSGRLESYMRKSQLPAAVSTRLEALLTLRNQLAKNQREIRELSQKRYRVLDRAREVRASLAAIGKGAPDLRRKLLADLKVLDRESEKILIDSTSKGEHSAQLRAQLVQQVQGVSYDPSAKN